MEGEGKQIDGDAAEVGKICSCGNARKGPYGVLATARLLALTNLRHTFNEFYPEF